jgi:hypothetical protein
VARGGVGLPREAVIRPCVPRFGSLIYLPQFQPPARPPPTGDARDHHDARLARDVRPLLCPPKGPHGSARAPRARAPRRDRPARARARPRLCPRPAPRLGEPAARLTRRRRARARRLPRLPSARSSPLFSFPDLCLPSLLPPLLTPGLAPQPLALLSLGLVAPTLYLFWREAANRVAFVEALARRRGLRAAVAPPPSLLGYWAFAAPAVVLLYAYVRV